MTDHLPECPGSDEDWLANWWDATPCVCSRLRACEQRVLKAAQEAITRTCHHTKYEGCWPCPHDDAIRVIETL